ncbi:MAG: type II secretion system GspH family protein [Phycisphaerae bacterium]|nr:type II secretion system GspH family protein [Phycisphaerae bacterium]
MRKKKGFTLIELLVVIAIIAMLLAILMPALSKVKKIAMRVVCATNLKGLGTAQTVYANDYGDEYTVQGGGGAHTWSDRTAGYDQTTKNWATAGNITVGASLYLLIREADVSPKSFVCPSSEQQEFSGKNLNNLDIVELWDFGHPTPPAPLPQEGPVKCVSYSYHQPYAAVASGSAGTGSKSRRAADGTRSAAFAVMADKSPYFSDDKKLLYGSVTQDNYRDRSRLLNWADAAQKWEIMAANSGAHDRESQNVLFADGHASNENRADVGVKNDEIYTQWSGGANAGATEGDRRTGNVPNRTTGVVPQGTDDSVLVNDDLQVCPTS